MKNSFLFTLPFTFLFLTHVSYAENKLEEVVVTSSQVERPIREIGASVSVIDSDEIKLQSYPSLANLLRTEAGVSSSNTGGQGKQTSLRIRGEEGFRTQVRIDGINVSDPTTTQVGPLIQHIGISNDIERIEILRGPQGFVYGADAGGVINIFTRSLTQGTESEFRIDQGTYDSSNISGYIANGNDQGSMFVSLQKSGTDGFNARVSDTENETDGYENFTWHSKAEWHIQDKLTIKGVFRDTEAENEFDNCFDSSFATSNNCDGEFRQSTARASVEYRQDQINHEFAVSNSNIERKNFTNGVEGFSASGYLREANYIGELVFNTYITQLVGIEQKTEHIDATETRAELERDQHAIFTELLTNPAPNLYLNAGIRYDDSDDFGNHSSIRLSVAKILELSSSSIKLRASYGTGFRAPSLSEIAYNLSSAFGQAAETTLKEENSKGYDLGFDVFFSNGASLELTVFNQEIENQIYFDLLQYSGYLQDNGQNTSEGIEFAYSYPLDQYVSFKGNYTYNETKDREGLQRIRRPEESGNIGVEFTFFDTRLKALANVRFSRDSVDEIFGEGQVDLDNYEVFDVSARFEVDEHLQIFARAENIFNDAYEEVTGFNTTERTVNLGLNFSF